MLAKSIIDAHEALAEFIADQVSGDAGWSSVIPPAQ